jgi:hypothetical protein
VAAERDERSDECLLLGPNLVVLSSRNLHRARLSLPEVLESFSEFFFAAVMRSQTW